MLFFCCTWFGFAIDDVNEPLLIYIYKHFLSFISCDLIKTTLIVLLELISVRNGAFCLDQFHGDLVRSMMTVFVGYGL